MRGPLDLQAAAGVESVRRGGRTGADQSSAERKVKSPWACGQKAAARQSTPRDRPSSSAECVAQTPPPHSPHGRWADVAAGAGADAVPPDVEGECTGTL